MSEKEENEEENVGKHIHWTINGYSIIFSFEI